MFWSGRRAGIPLAARKTLAESPGRRRPGLSSPTRVSMHFRQIFPQTHPHMAAHSLTSPCPAQFPACAASPGHCRPPPGHCSSSGALLPPRGTASPCHMGRSMGHMMRAHSYQKWKTSKTHIAAPMAATVLMQGNRPNRTDSPLRSERGKRGREARCFDRTVFSEKTG
jgi:hypothetical protein